MKDRFGKERNIEFEHAKAEYLKLGLEKKQLTRAMIAAKFEIDPAAVSSIAKIDQEDFNLIQALLRERTKIAKKREHLRVMYYL